MEHKAGQLRREIFWRGAEREFTSEVEDEREEENSFGVTPAIFCDSLKG
jgi:hypothetical protein